MFAIGQKVVFIADYSEAARTKWADDLCIDFPLTGQVYTVRRVVQRVMNGDGVYGIMLAEILNMENALDYTGVGGHIEMTSKTVIDEVAFDSSDFRPLVEAEVMANAKASVPV